DLYARYQDIFLEALRLKTTNKKHTNVLMHMLGYFKGQLSADEKQEMLELIDQYRLKTLPLIVPMTLMSHYVRKYDEAYLKEQTYLQPHTVLSHLHNLV